MVTSDVATRLNSLTQAAAACFARLGYQRTKVADIASAAGMSVGTVYLYVESKESLFHLVIAESLGESMPGPEQVPFVAPSLSETLDLIERGLRRDGFTPVLKQAAQSPPPDDLRGELASIVDEQYTNIAKLRRALSVIEACAADIPPLEEAYFGRRRRRQIDLLVRYLQRRAAEGELQPLPDMAVAAQVIHETVAWFAWKRLDGRDADRFDDESARDTVIEFCCNAIVGPAVS